MNSKFRTVLVLNDLMPALVFRKAVVFPLNTIHVSVKHYVCQNCEEIVKIIVYALSSPSRLQTYVVAISCRLKLNGKL